jgi:hypothetical protein
MPGSGLIWRSLAKPLLGSIVISGFEKAAEVSLDAREWNDDKEIEHCNCEEQAYTLWRRQLIPRRAWLAWSFVGMAVLFAAVGGSYFRAANSDLHGRLTIVLYVLCQLLFNLGPNTLTFIIPAEIFPTRYQGTYHGISAAAGKLGSVVVWSCKLSFRRRESRTRIR